MSHTSITSAADTISKIAHSTPVVVTTTGRNDVQGVPVSFTRDGNRFRYLVRNDSPEPVRVREIILADFAHQFPAEAAFYGEGFSMFCSTVGTVGAMENGDPSYTDVNHYKLPGRPGYQTIYNYLRVSPSNQETLLVGFTSCKRFSGRFHMNPERLQIVVDTEGLTLLPGKSWDLEELGVTSGPDAGKLMEAFAARLEENHPRLGWTSTPTGWCSWYGYGPGISAEIIGSNLDALKGHTPDVRYVQIDDGYQPWMGDWLEPHPEFPGGVEALADQILKQGFQPAIWVAPFIASPESKLFREHPDWFVRGEDGSPLSTKGLTFPGWRQGPWYMLDGTHPGAIEYLKHVFRTMRSWGITYFKLDANAWGSLPFGHRYNPDASSIEAYRQGMGAIIEASGPDSFILGCNHAYWPSLGVIHGSRTSYDVGHEFGGMQRVARQNLPRNWMNDRLWWNDPDCVLVPKKGKPFDAPQMEGPDGQKRVHQPLTQGQLRFHLTATTGSGGLVLSGDRVIDYDETQWKLFRLVLDAPRKAANFQGADLTRGECEDQGKRWVYLLNWEKGPTEQKLSIQPGSTVIDYWTGEKIEAAGDFVSIPLAPHDGAVLVIESRQ